MFGRLFGKPKEELNIGDSIDKLKEVRGALETTYLEHELMYAQPRTYVDGMFVTECFM